ncbi:MAG: methyltransferase domain-containing protein [Cyclobacteriaceae bacterium]
MKYLNLGCGSHFVSHEGWTNIDFVSTGPGVVAHNLLDGIPFEDSVFDMVYHSHVLEHFSKEDGFKLIQECLRVLKPKGVIRIAVPDLERIVRGYLEFMNKGLQDPQNEEIWANYQWMMLEMYDQTVRSKPGGEMLKYLSEASLTNEDFIFSRIGVEGKTIRKKLLTSNKNNVHLGAETYIKTSYSSLKRWVKLIFKNRELEKFEQIGRFRLSGEIHQWMYDRYSLSKLLSDSGFFEVSERSAFDSFINGWKNFHLDSEQEEIRKPDSLFIEALKK